MPLEIPSHGRELPGRCRRISPAEYVVWKVKENPKFGCTVYDGSGKIADQILNAEHLARIKRANAPNRQFLVGTLFLVCGCALVWADSQHDWMLIIGFLIGARLGGPAKILLSLSGRRAAK